MIHKTVLLQEAIDGLDIHSGEIFVDGTLGNGGHTEEVCKRFGNTVAMIGIDLDPDALARSQERLSHFGCNVKYSQNNFRNIDTALDSLGVEKVNKILLDIGLSSNQFEESGRGFSFQKDEPLIMSFKKDLTENDLTAREIVNTWDEENIRAILEGYGEEQFAYRIAKGIVRYRQMKSIETTAELVDIILSATPKFYHHRKIHPATKTFQALRITVNDEIENLKEGLRKSFVRLAGKGRIAVISFHSLEDRIVKDYFRKIEDDGLGKRVNKKPIIASEEEIQTNPRSRSAKLRIVEKN
ncbi:MAG: 16S rRNA (cytosine(1402)-N(4))-methyltransferase RsmH [bacterium]